MTTGFFVLSGLFVGSFLNVCIDRLPTNRSLAFPRSHCENCHRALAWYENLPLVSYLVLRGKCHTCRAIIPFRVFLVEALSGALFGYLGFRFGVSTEGIILALYASILIVIIFIDLERMLILNLVVFPATLLALGLSPLLPDVGILKSLYGALAAFGLLVAVYLVSRGGMGAGEVKLAAFIGTATGFPLALANLFLSITAAGVVAVLLLLFKIKGRKDVIPFGPFLAGGAVVTLLWGQPVLDAYERLL